MKMFNFLLLVLILFLSACCGQLGNQSAYLKPIMPDGFINLPLVGKMHAAGLTLPKAREKIWWEYRRFHVSDLDLVRLTFALLPTQH